MDINVVRKQNAISIAGNIFQCVDSNPVITASYSGDNVSILDNLTSRWVVKDAPYDTLKNEAGNAIGANPSQVVSVINAYAQADNPEGVIKNTDKITALAEVDTFDTSNQGYVLISSSTSVGGVNLKPLQDLLASNDVLTSIVFDLSNPDSLSDGRLAYDTDRETLIFQSINGELAIGEIYKPVVNNSGGSIPAGSVVKAVGVSGERFQIQLFDPTSDEELYLIGVTQSAIANGDEGIVVTQGIVKHIDTSLWPVGTVLYADAATPGGFKNTSPTSPNLAIPVAMVMKQDATNGTLFVRPTIYAHLDELHDVSFSSLSNNDLLKYNASTGVWTNGTIDTDEVSEGSSNLYWTQGRFNTAFAGGISGITSDDIADGSTTVIMTTSERSKLTGIDSGAEVNVNADWNAVSGDAQILNKPTIPTEFADLSGNADDVPEGQTNKYYTDTKVQTYLTAQKIRANYPTATYTGNTAITATHEQTMMVGNSPTGITFQVSSGLARDCEILVMQYGAGDITITGATGVTIRTSSSFQAITGGQYAIIGLKQIGTTNEYIVTGERKLA